MRGGRGERGANEGGGEIGEIMMLQSE